MTVLQILQIAGFVICVAAQTGTAVSQTTEGRVLEPSAQNLDLTWKKANIAMPGKFGSGAVWMGPISDLVGLKPADKVPVVIFMHGSSGIAQFVKDYQKWLANELGLISIAPDSMAIPDRLTYKSPIDKITYERVHDLRLAELKNALSEVQKLDWVDPDKIIIIGTSEGAVPVARLESTATLARVIYAWSCEANYFVEAPKTAIPQKTPVLSMIAAKDPFFSPENTWSKNQLIRGTCSQALKDHEAATVVTLSTDKHTIINFKETQDITKVFLLKLLNQKPL